MKINNCANVSQIFQLLLFCYYFRQDIGLFHPVTHGNEFSPCISNHLFTLAIERRFKKNLKNLFLKICKMLEGEI